MANVTVEEMEALIREFHREFQTVADRILEGYQDQLERYRLLTGHVLGLASTQFGAGIEYLGGDEPRLEIVRTTERVDERFFRVPQRSRWETHGRLEIYDVAQFSGLTFKGSGRVWAPIRLTGDKAFVRFVQTPFFLTGRRGHVALAERFGRRDREFWNDSSARTRAQQELFQAHTDLKQSLVVGLTTYLTKHKTHSVLLLGDFSAAGRARLDTIRNCLESQELTVIDVSQVPENVSFQLSLEQKVAAIALAVRFVVMDDSSRSGHLRELPIIENNHCVCVILRLRDGNTTYMTMGASIDSNNFKECPYDMCTLSDVVRTSVEWAEERVNTRTQLYSDLYPWRRDDSSSAPKVSKSFPWKFEYGQDNSS